MLCPNHPHFWSALTLAVVVLFSVHGRARYSVYVRWKNYPVDCVGVCCNSYHYHRYIWPPILTVPDLQWHWGSLLQLGPEDDCRPPPEPGILGARDSRLSITMSLLCSWPWLHSPPHRMLSFILHNDVNSLTAPSHFLSPCHISSNRRKLHNLGLINRF